MALISNNHHSNKGLKHNPKNGNRHNTSDRTKLPYDVTIHDPHTRANAELLPTQPATLRKKSPPSNLEEKRTKKHTCHKTKANMSGMFKTPYRLTLHTKTGRTKPGSYHGRTRTEIGPNQRLHDH